MVWDGVWGLTLTPCLLQSLKRLSYSERIDITGNIKVLLPKQ